MSMLTAKEHRLMAYIEREIGRTRTIPDYRTVKELVGIESPCDIHRLMYSLKEKGFISFHAVPSEVTVLKTTEGEFQKAIAVVQEQRVRKVLAQKIAEYTGTETAQIDAAIRWAIGEVSNERLL